jgi:uncharacterized protein (TIGR04255 family)
MTENRDLPSYRKPPINEVVCGVQFEEIPGFSSIHYGRLLQRIAADYPSTEDQPPLAEVFEVESGREVQMQQGILTIPPLRRVWYIDPSGNYLLQVQPSRFHANWRHRRDEDEYPRFEAAYDRFLGGWKAFLEFLDAEKLPAPRANQYELTYINHIPEATVPFPAGMEEHLGLFNWRNAQALKFLPAPRTAQIRVSFPLPDTKGMLTVAITHGVRKSDKKGLTVMELTARGSARGDTADMSAWFALAHEWIVKGFTDLTTTEAHKRWDRER